MPCDCCAHSHWMRARRPETVLLVKLGDFREGLVEKEAREAIESQDSQAVCERRENLLDKKKGTAQRERERDIRKGKGVEQQNERETFRYGQGNGKRMKPSRTLNGGRKVN